MPSSFAGLAIRWSLIAALCVASVPAEAMRAADDASTSGRSWWADVAPPIAALGTDLLSWRQQLSIAVQRSPNNDALPNLYAVEVAQPNASVRLMAEASKTEVIVHALDATGVFHPVYRALTGRPHIRQAGAREDEAAGELARVGALASVDAVCGAVSEAVSRTHKGIGRVPGIRRCITEVHLVSAGRASVDSPVLSAPSVEQTHYRPRPAHRYRPQR